MISGPSVDQLVVLLVVAAVLVITYVGMRRSSKLALAVWVAVICFVPVWLGVSFHAFFPAFTAISLLSAASMAPMLGRERWSVADALLGSVLVLVALEYALQMTTRSATFDLFSTWASAFLLGRLAALVVDPEWIYGLFGVAFTVVAVLAILEFVTGTNPFISYLPANNTLFGIWGGLQPRGSVVRAEGAFGHSIALSTSLGVAITLTLGSRFRTTFKTAMVLVMAVAAVLTFSRAGMAVTALGVVLTAVFVRHTLSRAYRFGLIALTLAGVALGYTLVAGVFAESTEAGASASYRADLLGLVSSMQPFGLSAEYAVSTTRSVSIGTFGSIDNAVLLFGLIYGWVPLVLVSVLLVAAVVVVVSGRATPATVAVAAQLPSLLSVAFITQYAGVAWFCFGLALSSQLLARRRRGSSTVPAPQPIDGSEPPPRAVPRRSNALPTRSLSASREVHSP